MVNTVGRFSYRIRAPKKGDMPVNAVVYIIPKTYATRMGARFFLLNSCLSRKLMGMLKR